MVRRLVDEAQGLLSGPDVAVQLEHRRSGEEEALGRGGDERGEVGQGVRRPERAVRAVRGEDLHDRLDIVLGHADGVAGEQLLDLLDVLHLRLIHGVSSGLSLLGRARVRSEKAAFPKR